MRERLRSGPRAVASTAGGASAASAPGQAGAEPDARRQNFQDLQNMLDAVSRMAEVVGMASAQRYRNGGMKSDDVDDMLFACKDVMVAADPLRRRLRPNALKANEAANS